MTNVKCAFKDFVGKVRWSLNQKRSEVLYGNKDIDTFLGDDELIWADNIVSFNALNDFELWYNHKTKIYYINYETMFGMKLQSDWCDLLKSYLECFEKFMDKNEYDKCFRIELNISDSVIFESKNIEELYKKFELYVKGFCVLYENDNTNIF